MAEEEEGFPRWEGQLAGVATAKSPIVSFPERPVERWFPGRRNERRPPCSFPEAPLSVSEESLRSEGSLVESPADKPGCRGFEDLEFVLPSGAVPGVFKYQVILCTRKASSEGVFRAWARVCLVSRRAMGSSRSSSENASLRSAGFRVGGTRRWLCRTQCPVSW